MTTPASTVHTRLAKLPHVRAVLVDASGWAVFMRPGWIPAAITGKDMRSAIKTVRTVAKPRGADVIGWTARVPAIKGVRQFTGTIVESDGRFLKIAPSHPNFHRVWYPADALHHYEKTDP